MKYQTVLLAGMVGLAAFALGVGDAPQRATEKRIAVVGDRIVGWNDLGPMLAEAAGGQVLEEYALGVTLKEECTKRGIKVGETDIRAERELLGKMLAKVAGVPETEAESLIRSSRRTRGLGDIRFRGLLERNAALRAMVREGVGVDPIFITPEDIATAYELKYGPRVRARLLLVRSQATAATARNEIKGGAPFADVAARVSIDPSADRGGLLDPVSLLDSDYPVAVRTALGTMKPGDVSEPIAVTWSNQSGFAVVQLVETIAAPASAPSKDAASKDLELEIRTVRERAQMDKLGKMLVRNAGISALEPSLNWSWELRSKQ